METSYFYKHDFLRTAMTGFIASLDNLFESYKHQINNKDFPIMIINSGDEVYLSNITNIGKKEKEHYDLVPRMSMSFGSISLETDQLTAPGIVGKIIVKNTNGDKRQGLTHLRRMPLTISFSSEVVFSKIHELLAFVEYYFSAISHVSLGYEFVHNGITHQGVFDILESFDKDTNFNLTFSSDKREHRLPLAFTLNLQMPAYNLYKAKGFNYLEEPGVVLDYSVDNIDVNSISNCNNCNVCSECTDPNKGQGMVRIIHNMHMSDPSVKGILSTTIIEN